MKIKSFIRQFIATVNGDDAEAQAQKTLRQADSALKSQIASLEGDTINLEDAVEQSKEAQAQARINHGELINDRNYYVRNLLSSKNSVTAAEEALKTHLAKIAFLRAEQKALDDVEDVVEAAKA